MKEQNTESIRRIVLSLIESEYLSDAAFERAVGIPDKTVNNWRRGRSASFMHMLPTLADTFRVSISELMDMPVTEDGQTLSPDEVRIITLYRKARTMPESMRRILTRTIEDTISSYVTAWSEAKRERGKKAKKQ